MNLELEQLIKERVELELKRFSKVLLSNYELDKEEIEECVKNFMDKEIESSIKVKADKAAEKKLYYNVNTNRYMKKSIQNENLGFVFYPDLNICGKKNCIELTNAVAILKGKKIKHIVPDKVAPSLPKDKINLGLYINEFGNYEHKKTKLIFTKSKDLSCKFKVFGKQDYENSEVLELTDKDIELCKKYGFEYERLSQNQIDENIMELTSFR